MTDSVQQRVRIPDSLNTRQKMFCREYVKDGNATRAALRAGYGTDAETQEGREKAAAQRGAYLLKDLRVRSYVDKMVQRAEAAAEVDASYVIANIKEVVERSMQAVRPVVDRQGNPVEVEGPDGELAQAYTYDASAALKGLEMLGKWQKLRLFSESVELTGRNGGPIETISASIPSEDAALLYKDLIQG